MKSFKLLKRLTVAVLAMTVIACISTNLYGNSVVPGSVGDDLEKAKKEGKAVFLIITGLSSVDISAALTVANEANKKYKKSVVLQMNKDDVANKDMVAKYGIAGVPVPFILVISSKGYAVGGYTPAQATAENLINVIPSPKYDEVLVALNNKKPVFVVASKKTFTDKNKALASCKSAVEKVPAGPAIVEIDMDDANEAKFLSQIGVNMASTSTVTVVINTTGNVTANYLGITDPQALATAATKVVKSCCPGGSSSGCSPAKK